MAESVRSIVASPSSGSSGGRAGGSAWMMTVRVAKGRREGGEESRGTRDGLSRVKSLNDIVGES